MICYNSNDNYGDCNKYFVYPDKKDLLICFFSLQEQSQPQGQRKRKFNVAFDDD